MVNYSDHLEILKGFSHITVEKEKFIVRTLILRENPRAIYIISTYIHIQRHYCFIIYVDHFWPPNYCKISL